MAARTLHRGVLGLFSLALGACQTLLPPCPPAPGCDCAGEAPAAVGVPPATLRPGEVVPGTEIVVADVRTSFGAAHVTFVRGRLTRFYEGRLVYEHGAIDAGTGQRAVASTSPDEAWLLAAALDPPPARGERLVGRFGEDDWRGCEIVLVVSTRAGDAYRCEAASGLAETLEARQLVRPSARVQAIVGAEIDAERFRRDFESASELAGTPTRPAGWAPSAGARVLTSYMGWSSGVVTAVTNDAFTVELEFWGARELRLVDMWPLSWATEAPAVRQFVLIKDGSSWQERRVTSVHGNRLVVHDENGEQTELSRGQVVPLSP